MCSINRITGAASDLHLPSARTCAPRAFRDAFHVRSAKPELISKFNPWKLSFKQQLLRYPAALQLRHPLRFPPWRKTSETLNIRDCLNPSHSDSDIFRPTESDISSPPDPAWIHSSDPSQQTSSSLEAPVPRCFHFPQMQLLLQPAPSIPPPKVASFRLNLIRPTDSSFRLFQAVAIRGILPTHDPSSQRHPILKQRSAAASAREAFFLTDDDDGTSCDDGVPFPTICSWCSHHTCIPRGL